MSNQKTILAALQVQPMTAHQAADTAGTSYQNALNILSRLCDKGITRRNGCAKSKKGMAVLFEANPAIIAPARAGSEV